MEFVTGKTQGEAEVECDDIDFKFTFLSEWSAEQRKTLKIYQIVELAASEAEARNKITSRFVNGKPDFENEQNMQMVCGW